VATTLLVAQLVGQTHFTDNDAQVLLSLHGAFDIVLAARLQIDDDSLDLTPSTQAFSSHTIYSHILVKLTSSERDQSASNQAIHSFQATFTLPMLAPMHEPALQLLWSPDLLLDTHSQMRRASVYRLICYNFPSRQILLETIKPF